MHQWVFGKTNLSKNSFLQLQVYQAAEGKNLIENERTVYFLYKAIKFYQIISLINFVWVVKSVSWAISMYKCD